MNGWNVKEGNIRYITSGKGQHHMLARSCVLCDQLYNVTAVVCPHIHTNNNSSNAVGEERVVCCPAIIVQQPEPLQAPLLRQRHSMSHPTTCWRIPLFDRKATEHSKSSIHQGCDLANWLASRFRRYLVELQLPYPVKALLKEPERRVQGLLLCQPHLYHTHKSLCTTMRELPSNVVMLW